MRRLRVALPCLLAACGTGPQAAAPEPPAQRVASSASKSGLELVDLYGHPVRPLESSGRPVVAFFTSSECPISNRYAPEVGRLVADYRGEADFWIVYTNPEEGLEAIRAHALEHGYRARIALDPAHRLVRLAGARVTPEATVFSGGGELIYIGRIDDRWVDFGRERAEPTVRDLERVLLAVLAGAEVGPIRTPAVGCPIPALP